MADAPTTANGGGSPLKRAFSAKIGGVPVLAVGIPAVLIAGFALRMYGGAQAPAEDTAEPTSTAGNPVFLTKPEEDSADPTSAAPVTDVVTVPEIQTIETPVIVDPEATTPIVESPVVVADPSPVKLPPVVATPTTPPATEPQSQPLPSGYGWFYTDATTYTADSVARRYDITVDALKSWNPGLGITSGSTVLGKGVPIKVRINAAPWSLADYVKVNGAVTDSTPNVAPAVTTTTTVAPVTAPKVTTSPVAAPVVATPVVATPVVAAPVTSAPAAKPVTTTPAPTPTPTATNPAPLVASSNASTYQAALSAASARGNSTANSAQIAYNAVYDAAIARGNTPANAAAQAGAAASGVK